jgi:hypothetical protein
MALLNILGRNIFDFGCNDLNLQEDIEILAIIDVSLHKNAKINV